MQVSLSPLFRHDPCPLQALDHPVVKMAGVQLWIKRDDLLHTGPGQALCGNKWRKLQYNLQAARDEGKDTLLTFGGAYSNHIAAVAAAGQAFGFHTIGGIRGEENLTLNPTLRFATECGMQLQYVDRSTFREKHTLTFQDKLKAQYGSFYMLPEGGTNKLAIKGCMAIPEEVEQQLGYPPDYYLCSAGTGGTLAGIIARTRTSDLQIGEVIGFSALKGNFLQKEVQKLLQNYLGKVPQNWSINTDFHFGGYARYKPELITFINDFKAETGIPLDPVYTGKLFYGTFQLLKQGYFPKGSKIVVVHTGGLQGIAGFNERFGNLLK